MGNLCRTANTWKYAFYAVLLTRVDASSSPLDAGGWLGLNLQGIENIKASVRELGIEGMAGAFINDVLSDGTADKGCILPGDFNTKVGATEILNGDEFMKAVSDLKAGPFAGGRMGLSGPARGRGALVRDRRILGGTKAARRVH